MGLVGSVRVLVGVAVAAALLGAACGDSDDSDEAVPTTTVVTSETSEAPSATSGQGAGAAAVDLATGWVTVDAEVQGVVAAHSEPGVAVVGSSGDPTQPLPAWHSPTGEEFSEVSFAAPKGDPIGAQDIVANEDGFVAILFNSTFASFSADGITWEPIDLSTVLEGCALGVIDQDGATPGKPCGLIDVAAGPAGFVIVGGVQDATCTGVALHSTDGRQWTRSDLPDNCSPIAVTSSDAGFTILGLPDVVAASSDGTDWEAVTATGLPPTPHLRDRFWQLSASSDVLVLVGTQVGPNCDFVPGTWYSTDEGGTWVKGTIASVGTPAPDDAGFQAEDIVLTDFGFVAVGPLVSDPLCRPAQEPGDQGLILLSNDGVNWHQFTTASAIRNITTTADGLIGTGAPGIAAWTPPD